MKIGITFDLREDYERNGYSEDEIAEFDSVETIEAIESALGSLGHSTERIGDARRLVDRLAIGDRWDMVFNIAEGLVGLGRESLVPSLLDNYEIPYTFSDPLTLCTTLHKPTAKRIVRDHGIPTADFCVVETLADIERIDLPFPLFVKPVAEGTSKGISNASKVHNHSELRAGCERLLLRYRQSVLVESYLPGREFTIGILGTGEASRELGIVEIFLEKEADPEIYSYANKKHYEDRVRFVLVADAVGRQAADAALRAWIALGGRDAGRIDMRCDEAGRPNFLEANPLAGLHPTDSDLVIINKLTGQPYLNLIEHIMISASSRAAAISATV